jgi:hypothetical protein
MRPLAFALMKLLPVFRSHPRGALLYESPFTDSKGVEGVFEPDDVMSFVQVLRSIEPRRAAKRRRRFARSSPATHR